MERIVKFLGKHLFFPVIIRICQWSRCNQYLFYRIMWSLGYLFIAAESIEYRQPWGMALFIPAFLMCAYVAWVKWDVPSKGSVGLTFLFLVMAVANTVALLLSGRNPSEDMFSWFICFGEFARLIQTIPPTETKKKEATFTKKATNDA